jgi:tRNA A37 threonylcarbamoyladenosine modification protein TsaB
MAWRIARRLLLPEGAILVTVFDAKGEDVYAAEYELRGMRHSERVAAHASSAADVAAGLAPGAFLAGDGAAKLDRAAPGAYRILSDREAPAHAEAVALLGETLFAEGVHADLESSEPMYLRDFRTTVPKPLAG